MYAFEYVFNRWFTYYLGRLVCNTRARVIPLRDVLEHTQLVDMCLLLIKYYKLNIHNEVILWEYYNLKCPCVYILYV